MAGIFIIGAPWPLVIIFLIIFFLLKDKLLNKNSNPIITFTSTILFFMAPYLIFFGIGVEVGAEPLAKFTHSKLICRLIISDSAKDSCLRDISALSGDGTSCTGIGDSDKKNQCYWRVAENTLNIDLCDKAGSYEDMCIIAVAKGTGNKEYCDNMPENSTFSKNYCINSVK